MGVCFSLSSDSSKHNGGGNSTTAKVISVAGELREYATPVGVSHVLEAETNQIGLDSSSHFVCNSDSLYFDELIPALSSDAELRANQIYFVLPNSKREKPLSATDMAALAVKASEAMSKKKKTKSTKNTKSNGRVSPVLTVLADEYEHPQDYHYELTIGAQKTKIESKSEKESKLKGKYRASLRRLSSRRAKMAVRSFRLRLSTIYESTILAA